MLSKAMQTIAISSQYMRKVARAHNAAKPTSNATTSAAKPSAIPAAPLRKPSPGEKRITSAAQFVGGLQEVWFTVFDSNDTQATLRSSTQAATSNQKQPEAARSS